MKTLKNAGDKTRETRNFSYFFHFNQSYLQFVFFGREMKVHFVFFGDVFEEKKRMKEQTRLQSSFLVLFLIYVKFFLSKLREKSLSFFRDG